MFLEPSEKPKVNYTNHSWEGGKSCEELIMESPNAQPSSIRDKWHF